MDFGAIETNQTDCLSRGLFEDVYLDENFAECRKIHIVSDSDEFGILSLTPTAVGSISKRKSVERSKRGHSIALSWRLRAGMLHHTQQNRYRIRRDLFRVPILWHGGEIDTVWIDTQAQLDQLVEQATADFYGIGDRPAGAVPGLSVKLRRWLGDLLYRLYVRPRHMRIVIQAALGDRDAWRIICRAVKRAVVAS